MNSMQMPEKAALLYTKLTDDSKKDFLRRYKKLRKERQTQENAALLAAGYLPEDLRKWPYTLRYMLAGRVNKHGLIPHTQPWADATEKEIEWIAGWLRGWWDRNHTLKGEDMPLSDEDFRSRLADGKKHEQAVAEALREYGLDPVIPDEDGTAYETKEEFLENDVDIYVGDFVIEVKSRSDTCQFTSPDDFPFPDVFVDTKQGWESKKNKPDFYVIRSQSTGGMLVIPGDTSEQWDCRKVFDRACGFATWTLVANKDLAKSIEWMVDKIKNSEKSC